jgi:hypothetical protein
MSYFLLSGRGSKFDDGIHAESWSMRFSILCSGREIKHLALQKVSNRLMELNGIERICLTIGERVQPPTNVRCCPKADKRGRGWNVR